MNKEVKKIRFTELSNSIQRALIQEAKMFHHHFWVALHLPTQGALREYFSPIEKIFTPEAFILLLDMGEAVRRDVALGTLLRDIILNKDGSEFFGSETPLTFLNSFFGKNAHKPFYFKCPCILNLILEGKSIKEGVSSFSEKDLFVYESLFVRTSGGICLNVDFYSTDNQYAVSIKVLRRGGDVTLKTLARFSFLDGLNIDGFDYVFRARDELRISFEYSSEVIDLESIIGKYEQMN